MNQQPDNPGHENQSATGSDSHRYDVNFFKPKTEHSRADMKMIIVMILVWGIAVFGFQFMLCIFNQPAPEDSYVTFQEVWHDVQNQSASTAQKQVFSKAILSVLGKNVALNAEHKEILQKTLTQSVLTLLPVEQRETFLANLTDASKKQETVAQAAQAIGLQSTGFDKLRADLLPMSLVSGGEPQLSADIPEIMKLYLVHNQSALTDFKFLGFPFHYWYTAQFLLILFVALCLIYAYATDRLNAKYDFADE